MQDQTTLASPIFFAVSHTALHLHRLLRHPQMHAWPEKAGDFAKHHSYKPSHLSRNISYIPSRSNREQTFVATTTFVQCPLCDNVLSPIFCWDKRPPRRKWKRKTAATTSPVMTHSNAKRETYLTSPSSSILSCPPLPFHPSLRLVHGPRSDSLRLALLHDPFALLVLVL